MKLNLIPKRRSCWLEHTQMYMNMIQNASLKNFSFHCIYESFDVLKLYKILLFSHVLDSSIRQTASSRDIEANGQHRMAVCVPHYVNISAQFQSTNQPLTDREISKVLINPRQNWQTICILNSVYLLPKHEGLLE